MSTELFYRRLFALARACRHELDEELAEFYRVRLEDVPADALLAGLDRLFDDASPGRPFPSVNAIRSAATGKPASQELRQVDESEARTAANLALMAVSKFGSVNGTSEAAMQRLEKIRAWVGELGWSCVELKGGWNEFCRSLESYDMLPTVEAQMRELAKAQLDRRRRGVDLAPPALPMPEGRRGDLRPLSAADAANVLPPALRHLAAKEEK